MKTGLKADANTGSRKRKKRRAGPGDASGLQALGYWAGGAAIAVLVGGVAITTSGRALDADVSGYSASLPNGTSVQIAANQDIDRSLFTGSVEKQPFPPTPVSSNTSANSAENTASLRLAIASLQRQISSLHARNDRLERDIRDLKAGGLDLSLTTGSVASSGSAAQPMAKLADEEPLSSAQSAMKMLEMAENANSTVSSGADANSFIAEGSAALDLGAGVSFDALRARWEQIRTNSPSPVSSLEARAVLRDTDEGLQAHLVVGPLANRAQALELCGIVSTASNGKCSAVTFEGQRL
jgi:hypothetical protein